MNNPIVVFFDKVREVGGWSYQGILPVGVADGRIVGSEVPCQVLMLDDTLGIPNLPRGNFDSNAPLLVITHKTSGCHKPCDIADQLKNYGKAYCIDEFSHVAGDRVFEKIKTLLTKPATAVNGFVEEWKARFDVAAYVDLAAICQIKLLNPNADCGAQMGDVLGRLSPEIQEQLREFIDEECCNPPNYSGALKLAQTIAPPL